MRALLFLVGLGLAAPSSISPASQSPHVEAADSAAEGDETEKLLSDYDRALFSGRFTEALATAESISVDPTNKEGRGIVAAMRAAALLGLGRDAEATNLIREAERLAPQEPFASTVVFSGALLSDRIHFAADALDRLIGRFPDIARELDWDLVRYFLSNEPDGQDQRNEDRRIALARLGYGGGTEYGHHLTAIAVDILVKRGDMPAAAELLPYAKDPTSVEDMLIEKRYSTLWPQVEALAGPHLEKVKAATAAAERGFSESPDDNDKLQLYANALRLAGRLKEAIALRSRLPATPEAMAAADEKMGWAVNYVALALHSAGRKDDADELFALLNEAQLENGKWRVSMKINRVELLVSDGRFDRALPLIDVAQKSASEAGNDYARQLVRRLKYCTLSGLGQSKEAAKLLPEVLEHAQDAPGQTIDGLLCAGDIERAEQLALATLREKESFSTYFVRALQARPLTFADPSFWEARWQELRARPAIAKEFDRLGRDMPEQFLPLPPQ